MMLDQESSEKHYHTDVVSEQKTITGYLPQFMPSGRPWPRISVVTPTFKGGHIIENTIKSVLAQNYPNLEYIIMDGGSKDNAVSVIEKYSDRLTYWESEPDRGQSHAINKGFARATGDILTWLNDDDTFEPQALIAVALAFDQGDCDMVAGVLRLKNENGSERLHMASCDEGVLPLKKLLDLDGNWLAGRFFGQPEVFFSREIWGKAGSQVREDLFYSMDYELWLRFAEQNAKLRIIGNPLSCFLIHSKQKTIGNAQSEFKLEQRQYVSNYKIERGLSIPPAAAGRNLMSICIVSDSGLQFGAGIAHRRIGEALQASGHLVHSLKLLNESTFRKRPSKPEDEDNVLNAIDTLKPDVVLLGNIHSTNLSPLIAKKIAYRYPTFILTHDLWWLTGHCPYPNAEEDHVCKEECTRWFDYPETMASRIKGLFQEKLATFENGSGVAIAANSRWAEAHYRETLLQHSLVPNIYKIKLGVSTDNFRPLNKSEMRVKHRIPQDVFVVMTACSNVSDKRKGVYIILEALECLRDSNILLLVIGNGILADLKGLINVLHVGGIDNETLLAEYYACADLYLSASSAETFGQTLLEASACGVPLLAMGGSGTEDIVKPGLNGVLLRESTPKALADAIKELKNNPSLRKQFAFWGPVFVRNEFSYYSSYYSFHKMFEKSGVHASVHAKRNIDFEKKSIKDIADLRLEFISRQKADAGGKTATVLFKPLKIKGTSLFKTWLKSIPAYNAYREARKNRRKSKKRPSAFRFVKPN